MSDRKGDDLSLIGSEKKNLVSVLQRARKWKMKYVRDWESDEEKSFFWEREERGEISRATCTSFTLIDAKDSYGKRLIERMRKRMKMKRER